MSPQNTAPAWDRHSVYSTLKQAQAILNGAGPGHPHARAYAARFVRAPERIFDDVELGLMLLDLIAAKLTADGEPPPPPGFYR